MSEQPPRVAFVEQVMGLPVSIHVRGPRARDAQVADAVRAAFRLLHEADARFSTYRPDSEVCRIDRGELSPAEASPDLREVLALADRAREATGGLFDVRLPGPDGGSRFDPSGIVKGWAAARAGELLTRALAELPHAQQPTTFCLNAGGDVVVGGRPDPADPTDLADLADLAGPADPADRACGSWRIGIDDPGRPGLLGYVERAHGAVATSGSAARGEHVVDPRTGRPATALLAVTVTGPSLLWADVLATAAFVRGPDAVEWIRRFPGYAALAVRPDRTVLRSPGLDLHPLVAAG
jgi:thiamine biosynthesis lipoprotein